MVKFEWVLEEKVDWIIFDVATGINTLNCDRKLFHVSSQDFFDLCGDVSSCSCSHQGLWLQFLYGRLCFCPFIYTRKDKESISELSELQQNEVSTLKRVIQVANIGDVFRDTWEALKIGPRRQV